MVSRDIPDPDIIRLTLAIYVPMAVLAGIFIVGSTALFYHRSRTCKDLQRRSVPLAVAMGVASFIASNLLFARGVHGMGCYLILIGSYFGLYFVHAIVLIRSLRLIAMTRSASAKVQRLVHPERPLTFWERHPRLTRMLSDDRQLLTYMFLGSSPMIIFAILVLATPTHFSFTAKQAECAYTWEEYPITVVIFAFVLVIFPALIYGARRVRDAYAMRSDLMVACFTSIILDATFLLLSMFPETSASPFNVLVLPAFSVLIIQFSGVFLPWLRSQRQHMRAGRHAADSLAVLFRVMRDPDLLSLFCQFCEDNFCAELPFFLADYQRLKAKSIGAMAADKIARRDPANRSDENLSSPGNRWLATSKHRPSEKDLDSISLRKVESIEDLSGSPAISPLPGTIAEDLGPLARQPVPSELAIDFYCFYERYFAHGSIWEVNISGRTHLYLRSLVEREQFVWAMFDPAKDEVTQLLMEDVFGKFMRLNNDLLFAA
ncbi:hypothetical protein IWQ60_005513 [Tieghemiomyces parasiticus]|uniref:RGS domain-containing protein n=1 Tax=Tieghemiomyces parasiticus TaxID=78921 RepID=A0A9W8ADX3_9FUNG|nr:hypothetical protein IWQ60_005513 [Tieghemiomyces parasiticus]